MVVVVTSDQPLFPGLPLIVFVERMCSPVGKRSKALGNTGQNHGPQSQRPGGFKPGPAVWVLPVATVVVTILQVQLLTARLAGVQDVY